MLPSDGLPRPQPRHYRFGELLRADLLLTDAFLVDVVGVNAVLDGAQPGVVDPLGDVRVRRAMQLGTNVPQIIKTATFGYATQMAAHTIPASWSLDKDLKPRSFPFPDTIRVEANLDIERAITNDQVSISSLV